MAKNKKDMNPKKDEELTHEEKERKKFAKAPKGGETESFVKNTLNIDAKDTEKSMRLIEERIRKIQSIANQGRTVQKGFLSKEQVTLYQELLSEMESVYKEHYARIDEIESEQAEKLERLEKKIQDRKAKLDYAMGGNRWGDMASSGVIGFHAEKLQELYDDKNALESGEVEKLIDALKDNVEALSNSDDYARDSERIENMTVRDFDISKTINNLTDMISRSGLIMSGYQMAKYIGGGVKSLSEQETTAAEIGMKTPGFDGHEASIRRLATETGIENQYGGVETLQSQAKLLSAGSYRDRYDMARDTEGAQQFGRAFATDPDSLIDSFSDLRKLGAMDEGEMTRFAGLIAQAIKQGNMSGREEEFMQTSKNLLQSISSQIVGLDDTSVASVIKLQKEIGEATPELRGERGGDMLDRIDSSIKGGGTGVDLLLGRGTELKGLEGAEELRRRKQAGISDPENLQRILTNADERMAGNKIAKDLMIQDTLNLGVEEYKALEESGILERARHGDFNITDEELQNLEAQGHSELAESIQTWGKTETKREQSNLAKKEDSQTSFGLPFKRIKDRAGSAFYSMPKPLQHGARIGGFLAGRQLLKKGGSLATEYFKTHGSESVKDFIAGGGKSGFGARAGQFADVAKDIGAQGVRKVGESMGKTQFTSKVWEKGAEFGGKVGAHSSKLLSMADDAWVGAASGLGKFGESLASRGGGSLLDRGLSTVGKGLGAVGKGAAKIGGKVPILSTVIGTASDRIFNPEHNWGRSISKGIGSAVGTVGGLAASGALALGTGGTGLAATAGLTAGGSILGEKLGDSVYSFFAGSEDKDRQKLLDEEKKEQERLRKEEKRQIKLEKQTPSLEKSEDIGRGAEIPLERGVPKTAVATSADFEFGADGSRKLTSMEVETLNIEDRSLAEIMKNQAAIGGRGRRGIGEGVDIEGLLKETPKEHILTIDVRGNVSGMSPESEKEVTSGLKGLFTGLFGGSGSGFTLSNDQIRR